MEFVNNKVLSPQYIIINCVCELENLVNAGYTSYIDLLNLMKNGSVATNQIKNENTLVEILAHKANRGFVFLFGLSTLVLYRVNE